MHSTQSETRNWKREPWVWILIAIPSSAVIMGIVMVTLAVNSYSGLVVDDYYQQGKQINRVLARDRLAHELGLSATMHFDSDGPVLIRFDPEAGLIPGGAIELDLVHATRPGLDRQVRLEQVDTHLWQADLDLPGKGRWNLYLQTADWRLTGSWQHPGSRTANLLPDYFED